MSTKNISFLLTRTVADLDTPQKTVTMPPVKSDRESRKKDRIDITWRPEHKARVKAYAEARGMSFNQLVEMIMSEKVKGEKNVRR